MLSHGQGMEKGALSLKIFGDEDDNDEVVQFKACGIPERD